jgi:hypothetical protein
MFCSVGRNFLCASIALSLAASPSAVSSEQGAVSVVLPVRAGIISIRLESNRTTYRRGEPIKLRLMLVNNTNKYYAIMQVATPWWLCHLSIRDAHGQSIRMTLNRLGVSGNGDIMYTLPPDGSVPALSGLQAWTDLNSWGYALSRSGDYTIVGSPTIDALERIGHRLGNQFTVSPTETSNTVHIKILK